MRTHLLLLLSLVACHPASDDDTGEPDTVAWSRTRPRLADVLPTVRGRSVRRAIVHLHSPWSHDACDGDGIVDGEPNAACRDDLRSGLCDAAVDVAFFSDHPDYASWQDFDALFMPSVGDRRVGSALEVPCVDGTSSLWLAGIEDELMPVGLDRHIPGTPEERHALYNARSAEAILADSEAGALVLKAHTEGEPLEELQRLAGLGLRGIEVFNAHAMFAPDIRRDDLGLDGLGWATDIAPFTKPDATGEPDLLFLGVLQHQRVSLDRWDALLAEWPMVGVTGSDAHQNVLPLPLRDGERMDSYRRALSWFATWLLVDEDGAPAARAALSEGRAMAVFDVLGMPEGFDLYLTDAGGKDFEMGATSPAGTLHVRCPVVSSRSPHGEDEAEVVVTVLRDGEPWQQGCGDFQADTGVYRVEVEIVPNHLRPFLGEDPEPFLRPFPWIYSNAIRVR